MDLLTEVLFFKWMTGILLVSSLCWAVAFGVLAFRDRPRYRRGLR